MGVLYGNPETTSGGQALKFYASIRLDIRWARRGPGKGLGRGGGVDLCYASGAEGGRPGRGAAASLGGAEVASDGVGVV